MKKKKIIIISVATIVLLGICAHFILKASPSDSFQLVTTKLSTNKISTTVTATGTIEPITAVEVGTQVSGIISKLYVDYNSIVKKGQILAELDKTTLEAALKSKELDMKSSKTEFEYQKKNYERAKDLHEKNLISETDYETAKYTYEKAESTYKRNISDLVTVRTNLSYATIYSPIDGVVLSRAVEEGQTVAASFSTPTLFTIAKDLTKMRVIAKVDEADIGSVKQGQRVTFTVDAYPNDIFDGQVTQVRLEATTTSNVVTYQVVVNAPNPDLKLKPGLTANITIFTLEKTDISVLPNKALNFKPDAETMVHNGFIVSENFEASKNLGQNEKVVWQQDGKTIRNKRIKIGETDGINTEVISGVANTDQIITEMKTVAVSEVEGAKSSETSPFMPKRPGSETKTQKK
jgi:HlyD family secretion protein